VTTLAVVTVLVWAYLLAGHGRFWQAGPVLAPVVRNGVAAQAASHEAPDQGLAPVVVVVPARDEAPVIGAALTSLLAQDYAALRIVLVDDGSSDGTGAIARGFADNRLTVIEGAPRPEGWSGKLWAVAQGIAAAGDAELILLTDADIEHDPPHVATLVAQAQRGDFDLVSEMVRLSCVSWAERALVPAFVFFFQLLYPFAWVNNQRKRTAAAAGGTILIRRRALARIGGIAAVRGALIDDVALAAAVKRGGPIWLGHSALARSIRAYPGVADIWRMVTRTAYVQLRRLPLLLAGTVLAMTVVWLAPPALALFGHGAARWMGWLAWAGMAGSYMPTLRRFGRSPLWAPLLPLVAAFYTAATIGSAVDHHRGRGVAWKGRAYQGVDA
jgi:hopene-associated glycosyltransferase HpnB